PSCCRWQPSSSRALLCRRSLERPPARRSCVSRAESCQSLNCFFTHTLAALATLLGHSAEGQHNLYWPAAGVQCPTTFEQLPFLNGRVVEVAERALQLLQRTENAFQVPCIVETGGNVD